MTTLAQVHEALAGAVATVLPCDPYETDKLNNLSAQVVAPAYDPRLVLQGSKAAYPFKVRVYASRTTPEATFKNMCQYREATGPKSLIAAIQDGDNWPDGLVDYAQVQQVGEFQVVEIPAGSGAVYLAFELDVEVLY
jgi:hypothetical protein